MSHTYTVQLVSEMKGRHNVQYSGEQICHLDDNAASMWGDGVRQVPRVIAPSPTV